MKVVLLVGGFGARICEESQLRTKPIVELILWRIMKRRNDVACGQDG